MMQLLDAGGYPVLTDHKRQADDSNPQGYWEWEEIRSLHRNAAVLEAADGMAVKVVTPLLSHLPRHHRYHIIFMRRPVRDIALSQHRMRYGCTPSEGILSESADLLSKHLNQCWQYLDRLPHKEVLEINFVDVLSDPSSCCQTLQTFLKSRCKLETQRMISIVRPELNHGAEGV
ncbi:MAG: hypothetical protein LR015_13065 [Verrucomicrobia bacterium]|nr:hypothetical protein [Verrucomicrobiota bacterium]